LGSGSLKNDQTKLQTYAELDVLFENKVRTREFPSAKTGLVQSELEGEKGSVRATISGSKSNKVNIDLTNKCHNTCQTCYTSSTSRYYQVLTSNRAFLPLELKSIFTLFDLDPEIVARLVEKIIAGSSPYEGQFLEAYTWFNDYTHLLLVLFFCKYSFVYEQHFLAESEVLETLLILLGNAVRTQKNICKKIRQEADEYNH
jgi:hypothetical protein